MAQNKYALIRYRTLDKCLSNRKIRYGFVQLHAHVNKALEAYDPQTKGVSRSQLYADIEFMKSSDGWNADIETLRDGRNTYLRYAEEGFSIQNMPLNELELTQLNEALNLLKQFKGMPQFEWMEEVTAKLQQDIKPEQTQPIITFDANQYLRGIEWLGAIFNAAQYRKPLLVSYQDFKALNPYEFTFHPYYLKQYNNRWFVFGHCPENETSIRTVALDRIVDIKELHAEYIPNTEVDFETYFEDIIGVTRPADVALQKIELHIASQRAGYVLTKPLHGSQKKLKQDDTGLYFSLEVIPNPELLQAIFSFGRDIVVLSPESLREKVGQALREAAGAYQVSEIVSDASV